MDDGDAAAHTGLADTNVPDRLTMIPRGRQDGPVAPAAAAAAAAGPPPAGGTLLLMPEERAAETAPAMLGVEPAASAHVASVAWAVLVPAS